MRSMHSVCWVLRVASHYYYMTTPMLECLFRMEIIISLCATVAYVSLTEAPPEHALLSLLVIDKQQPIDSFESAPIRCFCDPIIIYGACTVCLFFTY